MKLKALAATMSLALTVGLVGCSSSGDENGTSDSQGSLTVAKPDGPITTENDNPLVGDSSAMRLGYANAIYEPVGIVNLINPSAKPEPWLAKEITWNSNYTQLQLTARDGVKWNDGEPFSAQDIAFTYELLKKTPALDTFGLGIKSITVSGDKVTLTFAKPMFVKQDKVLNRHVLPKHVWEKVSDPAKFTDKNPVGTGPYKLSKFSSQSVELTARDDYWKGKPAVATLFYVSYNDNTALTTALASEDADWAQAFIPNVKSSYLDKDKEHNKYWAPAGLGTDTLFLNTTKKPFNNVAFRKALNLVVDRDKHAKIAREGGVPTLTSVTGMPTPVGDPFISATYKDKTYKPDVDAAKKVLTDAGYKWSAGKLIDPQGSPVTFKMSVPQGWSDYVTGISLIADSAKTLGAEAKLNTPDADSWWAARAKGDFDAILQWTDTGSTPYDLYSDIMDGRWLKPTGQAADFNFGRYKNDAATQTLASYATASDDASRAAALSKIEDIFVNDVPAIPVGTRPFIGLYNTRQFTGWPTEEDPYALPDPTQPSAVYVLTKLKAAK